MEACPRVVTPLVIPEMVTLPDEIDITNADCVLADLEAAFHPRVTVVIADMTRTTFCDSAGARTLLRASDLAARRDAELRLVVRPGIVQRALTILGFDRLLRIYPTLAEALASGSPPES